MAVLLFHSSILLAYGPIYALVYHIHLVLVFLYVMSVNVVYGYLLMYFPVVLCTVLLCITLDINITWRESKIMIVTQDIHNTHKYKTCI
jgi:hypothetical protein